MLGLLLYFSAALVAVVSAANGCSPAKIGNRGFDAKFYDYALNTDKGWNTDFFSKTYKTTLKKVVTGVTSINFQHSNKPDWVPILGDIYGYRTTISNYALELSGFYKAPISGNFTFILAADNGASLQFGSGQSCCDDASGSVTGDFKINTLGPYGGGGNTAVNVDTAYFDLIEGVYYPVKIVMFNWMGNTGLNLKVTDPSGNMIPDFGSQVFQATFENSKCYTTETRVWTESYTSTTTQTGSVTDTVIVEIPKRTTTTTIPWSNSYTSTSTVTGVLTNTVIVDVPKPVTTVTSLWTGKFTSTTTITGSTNLVIVNIPHATTTTTTPWTGSYTTSLTNTGSATDTVIVQVPKATITTTITWSNSFTTKYTATGSLTDTVVVDVPTPTRTVTSFWTGSFTTTHTVTGGPGQNNTVVVEVPHATTTVTKTWTGSFTTTLTNSGSETDTVVVEVPTPAHSVVTITSTWTGSFTTTLTNTGSQTDTVVVEVPTPTRTVTSFWTGSFTTTHTVTGGPGQNNTVVVEVPHATTTVTKTWTGSFTTTLTNTGSQTDTVVVEVPACASLSSSLETFFTGTSLFVPSSGSFSVDHSETATMPLELSIFYGWNVSHTASRTQDIVSLDFFGSIETTGTTSKIPVVSFLKPSGDRSTNVPVETGKPFAELGRHSSVMSKPTGVSGTGMVVSTDTPGIFSGHTSSESTSTTVASSPRGHVSSTNSPAYESVPKGTKSSSSSQGGDALTKPTSSSLTDSPEGNNYPEANTTGSSRVGKVTSGSKSTDSPSVEHRGSTSTISVAISSPDGSGPLRTEVTGIVFKTKSHDVAGQSSSKTNVSAVAVSSLTGVSRSSSSIGSLGASFGSSSASSSPSHISIFEGGASRASRIAVAAALPIFAALF